MLVKGVLILCVCAGVSYGADPVRYDYYSGKPITPDQLQYYKDVKALDTCTLNVEPCNPTEYRRVDGTCNSLKNPARGTFFVPMPRLLPAHFYDVFRSRKAVSGKDLTTPRIVRLNVLKTGKTSHNIFNHNVPGFGIFSFGDVGSIHDIENMIIKYPVCCQPEHLNDDKCTPNILPEDDPIHRFSGIKCMNSTRPLSFQDFNCTKDPVPSMIAKATAVFDLSSIYNGNSGGDKKIRSYEGGRLKVEEEDGKIFPPNGKGICPNNIAALGETRCYGEFRNSLLPVGLFIVWFVRNHNYYADNLAKINPCWDDERLFYEARELNIAHYLQILVHEWLVEIIGQKNLRKAGIIKKNKGFRDIYDENSYPHTLLEYSYSLRWFHLMVDSTAKFYDGEGKYLRETALFNLTFRTGFLARNDHMSQLTQGSFRVPCHDTDNSIDYEIANNGLPNLQKSNDVTAGDLNKGRYFGIAPYIEYIDKLYSKKINSFEDLSFLMTKQKILILKEVYENVADIDLMAGLWAENVMKDGHIPDTLARIIMINIVTAIKADRHWYERKNRPHAFTPEQLAEVRKMNLASLLCSVADNVSEVPKRAFLNISPSNPLVKCQDSRKEGVDFIPNVDFTPWMDRKCLQRYSLQHV